MELQLTPEEEAKLAGVAERTGRKTEELVKEAIDYYLRYDDEFVAAVEKGLAALDRGEYMSHEELGSRIDKLFES